ncbi:hypothetical protein BASA83_001797 [Batrachochytrium salamandrivorans]|nr:hypothetical protein BASA83_001797 [Batrachochytrium salamandrivorans]
MPFGLANAPAQFQRMMNSLFRDVIGKHVLVYLDDIVIYSDNMSDHIAQVQNVLRVLQDNGLYCKAEKCHFYKSEIKYLGYIISADGLRMDPSKISAVQSWPTPKKVRDLQVLLGFTNFYRALIHDYSSMTANLTKLFKKDAPFVWGPEQEKSLQDLKTAFANSDFLTHPDDSRPFILETDASDYAISGVLSQYDDSNTLRPIAFYARQMNSAEQNYEIYDKELLAVSTFMTTKKLTRRQARWSLELSEYDFSLTHRPGKLNGRADSLSRREDYKSNTESSNFQRILDPSKVVDLQSLVADMDLHLLLHSQVLEKVFVLESDWPLIIADFLAGEDNVWMDDVPEVILERCKRELKHFRFRDNSFLRNIGRWQVHCCICDYGQTSGCDEALSHLVGSLELLLPFERWGIDFYGPMAETKSGNKYLITCIDYATRWVLAKPVKDMT